MAAGEVTAYIALGANLGDRSAQLDAAVAGLAATRGVRLLRESKRFETAPVGGPPQGDFLNGAVCVATTLGARELLECMQSLETAAGRVRGAVRYAPRPLDLDLLLYGDQVIEQPGLSVPHPRLHQREFVLEPLREIAAEVVHPLLGRTVEALARDLHGNGAA